MENKRPRTSFFKREADANPSENVVREDSGSSDRSEQSERTERTERPQRDSSFDSPRGDRPERGGGDGERRSYGDRPERRDGDRPQRSSGFGAPRGDRPERSGGDGERRSYGDRPQRRDGDRPQRSGGFGAPRGDRPERSGGDSERRSYGDRPERRDGDRPQRSGGFGAPRNDRDDRGDRKPFDRDRKPFDRDRKPFDRDRKPYDRDNNSFDGERKSGSDWNTYDPAPLQAPENLVFGIHPVKEALEAGQALEKIYVKKDTEAAAGIIEYAEARGIQVQYVPIEKLDRLTKRNNHQGVVAVIPAIEYADFDQTVENALAQEKPALFVILDGVTDVKNFGAIARTAECVGADAIIIGAKNAAPINAEAMKTSAGALSTIPVCRVGSLRNTLKTLQIQGLQLVAATEKSTSILYESKLTGNIAVIMGSEETGISPDILRICDQKISIPLLGKIESLNVSAAAAVLLYEVVRQRFEEL